MYGKPSLPTHTHTSTYTTYTTTDKALSNAVTWGRPSFRKKTTLACPSPFLFLPVLHPLFFVMLDRFTTKLPVSLSLCLCRMYVNTNKKKALMQDVVHMPKIAPCPTFSDGWQKQNRAVGPEDIFYYPKPKSGEWS